MTASPGAAAAAIEGYHSLLESDPAAAIGQVAQLREALRRGGVTFGGEPMASFLRPHFVAREDWDRLRGDGRRLVELASRVARRAFDGDVVRLCDHLGLREPHARWVCIDPGEPDVLLSRIDAFLTPRGPRFIEINSDAPAGLGYGDRMAAIIRGMPVFRRFAERFDVSYVPSGPRVVDAIVGLWHARGHGQAPHVAIVDFRDVRTRPDQQILAEDFTAAGISAVLADPREMELVGERLVYRGTPVDVVYRRTVLSELMADPDSVQDFLRAYEDGRALFVNPFRCQLSEDKAFFALLADERFAHLLDAQEHALVARALPWTRRVEERRTLYAGREIDLVPWILGRRTELVLKPTHGYGGQSVFVGAETTPADWETAVGEALTGAWVVQERVPIPEERFPIDDGGRLVFESLKVNTNPFYVGAAEVGAVTRASRSSVINVSAGGGSVPTFVVSRGGRPGRGSTSSGPSVGAAPIARGGS